VNALELALRAVSPACKTCNDFRNVQDGPRGTKPCPDCGILRFHDKEDNGEAYLKFRAAAYERAHARPEVDQNNLSADEAAFYLEQTRAGHNKITVLSWIEGRRYDPSKDEEFVKLVDETIRKEREAFVE